MSGWHRSARRRNAASADLSTRGPSLQADARFRRARVGHDLGFYGADFSGPQGIRGYLESSLSRESLSRARGRNTVKTCAEARLTSPLHAIQSRCRPSFDLAATLATTCGEDDIRDSSLNERPLGSLQGAPVGARVGGRGATLTSQGIGFWKGPYSWSTYQEPVD